MGREVADLERCRARSNESVGGVAFPEPDRVHEPERGAPSGVTVVTVHQMMRSMIVTAR